MSDDGENKLTSEDKRILKYVADAAREEMPSRRGFIQGTTAAAAIGALGFGTGQATAQTQPAAGQVGTESNPVDVEAATVSTGSVSNEIGDSSIHTAWDGLVTPVGKGLGAADAVDPSSTSNPIGDANDAIEATGGGGTIILPPGVIEQEATASIGHQTNIVGWGMGRTDSFDDTTTNVSGDSGVDPIIEIDGRYYGKMDGFTIRGDGPTGTRMAGIGITQNATLKDAHIGRVGFAAIYGPAIESHTDATIFESCLGEHIFIGSVDAGDETAMLNFQNSGGNPINWMGHISAYPSDDTSNSLSRIVYSRSQSLGINTLNIGGMARQIVDIQGNVNYIRHYNWEPTHSQTVDNLILIQRNAWVGPGDINDSGGSPSINNVFRCFEPNNLYIHRPTVADGITFTNMVRIEGGGPTGSESYYFGPSSEVNNEAGTSTGLFRSLASAGTGNG